MSERDEALKRLADAELLTARKAPISVWKAAEFGVLVIIATNPIEFTVSSYQEMRLRAETAIEPKPYSGWRFVLLPDGGLRHEKIPTFWQRLLATFTPPTSEKE